MNDFEPVFGTGSAEGTPTPERDTSFSSILDSEQTGADRLKQVVLKALEAIRKYLRRDEIRQQIGTSKTERQKVIRQQLREQKIQMGEQQVEVERLLPIVVKQAEENGTLGEKNLFRGLNITVEVLDRNPEFAKVVGDIIEKDLTNEGNAEQLFYKSLELAHRGGSSLTVQLFKHNVLNHLQTQLAADPSLRAKFVGKAKELYGYVKDFDTALPALKEEVMLNYGPPNDGDIKEDMITDFINSNGEDKELKKLLLTQVVIPSNFRIVASSQAQSYLELIDLYQDAGVYNPALAEHRSLRSLAEKIVEAGDVAGLTETEQHELRKALLDLNGQVKGNENLNQIRLDLADAIKGKGARIEVAADQQNRSGVNVSERLNNMNSIIYNYLDRKEKLMLIEGPEGWEELFNNVIDVITADPSSEVLQDQTLMSKIAGLTDYIRSFGAEYFENAGFSSDQAKDRVNRWIQKYASEQSLIRQRHNYLRAILKSTNAEESAKQIYGNIPIEWYADLCGASIDGELEPERRRITIDANTVYDEAVMEEVAAKARRWFFIDEMKKKGINVSEEEHQLWSDGFWLKGIDLLAQPDISRQAINKDRRFRAWNMVSQEIARAQDAGEEISDREAIMRLKTNWKATRDIPNPDKTPEEISLDEMEHSFSDQDENLYHQVKEEIQSRGEEGRDISSLFAKTHEEIRQGSGKNILSPVEHRVFEKLMLSERLIISKEAAYNEQNGIKMSGGKEIWIDTQLKRRERYVMEGIRRARQHLIFSRRLQKIVSIFGTAPKDGGKGVTGLFLEKEMRAMFGERWFDDRYNGYDQATFRDVSGMTRLRTIDEKVAKVIGLKNSPRWRKIIDEAYAAEDKDPHGNLRPNARKGLDKAVNFIKEELGIDYDLMAEVTLLKYNTYYDSGWRIRNVIQDGIIANLENRGKLGSLTSASRYEYDIGSQLKEASSDLASEINRGAEGYDETLLYLLGRIRQSVDIEGAELTDADRNNTRVQEAKKQIEERLGDKNKAVKAIDKYVEIIREGNRDRIQAVFFNGEVKDGQGNTVREFANMSDEDKELAKTLDKLVNKELANERERFLLEQMASRLPTIVAGYFPSDFQGKFSELLGENEAFKQHLEVKTAGKSDRDLETAKIRAEFTKRDQLWKTLEDAMSAVQKQLQHDLVGNGYVDAYFELDNEQTKGKNLGAFLRESFRQQGIEGEYDNYKDTLKQMVTHTRKYFNNMQDGVASTNVLKKEGIEEGSAAAKLLGCQRFDRISRWLPQHHMVTTKADGLYGDYRFGEVDQPSVYRPHGSEFSELVSAGNMRISAIQDIHKVPFEKSVEAISAMISESTGWLSTKEAAIAGEAIFHSFFESVRPPGLMDRAIGSWTEPFIRTMMKSDNKKMAEWGRQGASRIMKTTGDPNRPMLQKVELANITEIIEEVDAFIQNPDVLEHLKHEFHITDTDIAKIFAGKWGSRVAIGITILIALQWFKAAKEELQGD